MIKLFIAFTIGVAFGVIMMSCFAVSGRGDRRIEEHLKQHKKNSNEADDI